MTRTIDERIEAVLEELSQSHDMHDEDRAILQRHFSEPWLDTPDGPGAWWRRPLLTSDAIVERVINYRGALYADGCPVTRLPEAKWQRVIGPSE